MSEAFQIDAEERDQAGTSACRRIRRLQDKVPAVVYGAGKKPVSINLLKKDLVKQLENEAFYSHILTLNLNGQTEQVVLKDLQRHPAKGNPLHADFLRVDATHKITMQVPLHLTNELQCVGVKIDGGILSHQLSEVEVSCLAKDLPESLELDVAELKLGQALHLSDIPLPEGVSIPALIHGDSYNASVVSVAKVRSTGTDESEEEQESPDAP